MGLVGLELRFEECSVLLDEVGPLLVKALQAVGIASEVVEE
jgi:hypothetical protein